MFAIRRLTTQREAKGAEEVYGGPGGSGVKLLAENLVHLLVSWCLRIAYIPLSEKEGNGKRLPSDGFILSKRGFSACVPPEDFLMSHWLNLWPHLVNL